MLYIKGATGVQHEWHVGESLPDLKGHVVTFQADGDELELILEALRSKPVLKHSENTKRVRIACIINSNGQWNCIGFSTDDGFPVNDDSVRDTAAEGLDYQASTEVIYWITAEIPIPIEQEVNGIVTPDK